MLHVVDPSTEDPQKKVRQVESFIDDFKKLCKELYVPQKYVAIDERIIKSRHRSGFRQFIKDKPTKWGIKLWVLVDSSNGYTLDFNIYIGRAAGQTTAEHWLGYGVVTHLMAPYFGKGYHLFVNNFYTTPTLFKHFTIRVSLPWVQFYQARVVSHSLLKTTKSGLRVESGGVCPG